MINPAPRCRFDLVKSVSVVEVFFLGSVKITYTKWVTFPLSFRRALPANADPWRATARDFHHGLLGHTLTNMLGGLGMLAGWW